MKKGISLIALLAWFALGGASTKCQEITNPKKIFTSNPPSSNVGPALPRAVYAPLVRSHELPYAEIALNNRSPLPTEVTLAFYSKNGAPSEPVKVALQPGEVRHMDVGDLIPEGLKLQRELGGLFVQYTGQWNQVAAQLTLISKDRKGSMDEPLRPDTDFRSGVQDAVWYLPEDAAASIALGNTTAADIVARLVFPGEESREVKLHPYETQVITLHRNSSSEAEKKDPAASVRVETSAPSGALRAVGYVILGDGMARTIRFYERATVRQPDLFAANLSTQNSEIQMVLKNIGDNSIIATPRFVPVGPGSASPLELPAITLLPGEAKVVDCTPLQELATANETFSRVGVHVRNSGEKGTLIGSLASLDLRAGNGYEIPLRDSGSLRNSGGSYPIRLDDDYLTFVTLMNVSNDPVEFAGFIRHQSGDYDFRSQKLAPGGSVLFDFRDLRNRKASDANGKTLPEDFERGQFNWSMHLGGDVPRMIGRSQIVSPSQGVSASYSCPVCCPDTGPYFIFNPWTLLTIPGGFEFIATSRQSITCYGSVWSQPESFPFTSANPAIADSYYVAEGQAEGHGYTPGSTVQSTGTYTVYEYLNDGMDCYSYFGTAQSDQPGQVVSISQDKRLWYFGNGISAPAGFTLGATNATLNVNGASTGTFKWTISNGTSMLKLENNSTTITKTNVNTVGISSTSYGTQANDVTVKLEYTPPDAGQTKTIDWNLDIDSPYKLDSNGSTTNRGIASTTPLCDTNAPDGIDGYMSHVPYRMLSFFGVQISNVGINESFGARTDVYLGNNWPNGAAGGVVSPSGTFLDKLCAVGSSLTPSTLAPQSPLTSTQIYYRYQLWYVGSVTPGSGIMVQNNNLILYRDHGVHSSIVSPVR